jgi:hypothetical protein
MRTVEHEYDGDDGDRTQRDGDRGGQETADCSAQHRPSLPRLVAR